MSILNVDKIQPIGGGSTITVDATDIQASTGTIRASTFSGDVSATGIGVTNINASGIVTATTFKGDGDFVELDVDGHTNLDNVSVAGVSTFTGNADFSAGVDVTGGPVAITNNSLTISSGGSERFNVAHVSGGRVLMKNPSNAALNLGTNNLQRIQITGDGKIQIGLPGSSESLAGGVEVVNIRAMTDGNLIVRAIGSIASAPSGSGIGLDVLNDANNAVKDLALRGSTVIFKGASAETLRIDSSGRLLVGTTSAGSSGVDNLVLYRNGNGGLTIRNNSNQNGNIFFSRGTSGTDEYKGYIQYQHAQDAMILATGHTERLRITGGGQVLIGTNTSPAYTNRRLTVYDSTNSGTCSVEIRGSSSGSSRLYFTSSTTSGQLGAYAGKVYYGHADNVMAFYTAGAERLRITSTGLIRMGNGAEANTESHITAAIFQNVTGTATILKLGNTNTPSSANNRAIEFCDGTGGTEGSSKYTYARIKAERTGGSNAGRLIFSTKPDNSNGPSEGLRIDSDGTVTLPASATSMFPAAALNVISDKNVETGLDDKANYHLVLANPNNDTGESIGLAFGITDTTTKVGAAIVHERDAAGSQGSLKFFCRPNNGGPPVKRLNLHANGDMTFNNCTTTINSSNYGLYFLNDSDSTKSIFIRHSREANGTHTTAEFYGNQGSMRIYGDGDVKNTNNSYGSLSDENLKQDIVDASSQWSDIKAIKVRKFRFKSNPTGDLQIGVVAQELETVSPKLVTEVATSSDDLTSTETVKAVKYSVLYMKAIKALQEAQTRIETLEAKVAALEGS